VNESEPNRRAAQPQRVQQQVQIQIAIHNGKITKSISAVNAKRQQVLNLPLTRARLTNRCMNACRFTLIAVLIIISGCSSKHHQAESFVKQGIQNVQKGDLDEALDDFDQAIELNPQNANAYYNRGIVKSRLKDWDGAIADFTDSIKFNPQHVGAYFYRGIAKQQNSDLQGALADYTQTIAFDPQLALVFLNRGIVKSQLEDWDGALADYTQDIKFNPKSTAGYFYRGIIKHQKGDLDGALADYTQALETGSKYTNAYYARVYDRRGNLKVDRGDLAGAIADFDQAIELSPQDGGSYMSRGVANYIDGHSSEALADFQKAVELKFRYYDYPRIYTWLVKAKKADQLAAANQELKDYLLARQDGADDWPVQVGHFLIGQLSQDDFLKAADSTDVKKNREQHCEVYFYIAIKHLLAGDRVAAKSSFQQCVDTNVKTFYEYRMARIKLKQLEGKN